MIALLVSKSQFYKSTLQRSVLEFINNDYELVQLYNLALEEMNYAVLEKNYIKNTSILFADLIQGKKNKLNIWNNEDFCNAVKTNNFLEKFKVFNVIIKINFKKGYRRNRVYNRAVDLFCDEILPVFNKSHLILKNTLDILLTKELELINYEY